jgi:hypothetical protein
LRLGDPFFLRILSAVNPTNLVLRFVALLGLELVKLPKHKLEDEKEPQFE